MALSGKRFDGHDFVEEAVRRGAKGILISKKTKIPSKDVAVLTVSDSVTALGAIAAFHRKKFSLPVIAVTGSNGKSTTKEMIAHILSAKGPVLKNEGTKNNQIGVPLTLLRLSAPHQFAVVELGMNHVGEIRILSKMVAPTVGVITNIGPAHLEFVGDLEQIFSCKLEILEGLEKGGTLVCHGEDPYLKKVTSREYRILFFGKGSQVNASEIRVRENQTFFKLDRMRGAIPLIGRHHVDNALAAIAVTTLFDVDISFALSRLQDFKGLEGRMSQKEIRGVFFIDDSYNANPESTRRALESFMAQPTEGKRIFVMGDMLELGEKAPLYHAAVGEEVVRLRIDLFMTVGSLSRSASEKASSLGMNGPRIAHFESASEAGKALVQRVQEGDRVLVKGSRGMKMEEVIRVFEGSRVQGSEGS